MQLDSLAQKRGNSCSSHHCCEVYTLVGHDSYVQSERVVKSKVWNHVRRARPNENPVVFVARVKLFHPLNSCSRWRGLNGNRSIDSRCAANMHTNIMTITLGSNRQVVPARREALAVVHGSVAQRSSIAAAETPKCKLRLIHHRCHNTRRRTN